MRKHNISILVVVTLIFVSFTLGYFLGRDGQKSEIIVSVSKEMTTMPQETVPVATLPKQNDPIRFPIAINQAGKEELMALPGIGDVLAERILAYRREHGAFRSAEELMNVEGIGKKRLEEMIDLIVIGG